MKPIAWYHPASKRVRWENDNLPASWLPLYPAPPKKLRSTDVSMSTIEKVERFLKERKSPAETKAIAHHFLLSKSTVQRALKELENAGKAQRKRKANKQYWVYTLASTMAIPREAPRLQNASAFSRPIQNSYPAIRGYED